MIEPDLVRKEGEEEGEGGLDSHIDHRREQVWVKDQGLCGRTSTLVLFTLASGSSFLALTHAITFRLRPPCNKPILYQKAQTLLHKTIGAFGSHPLILGLLNR
ncbi:hypothetical protein VPH35_103752 [Triticum aestivum]